MALQLELILVFVHTTKQQGAFLLPHPGWDGSLSQRYPPALTSIHFYYISQLVRTLRLVNFVGHTLLYSPLTLKISFSARPINLRDIINILLTSFSRSVLQVTDPHFSLSIYSLRALRLGHNRKGKNLVRNLQYAPPTWLVRGIYTWVERGTVRVTYLAQEHNT